MLLQKKIRKKKFFVWFHILRRSQIPHIIKNLDLNDEDLILDIGCGNGRLLESVKKGKIIGMDLFIDTKKISMRGNFFVIQGSGFQIPIKNNSVDKIVISSVLQMVKDWKGILKECDRVMKDNGIIVLTAPIKHVLIDRVISLKILNFINRNIPSDYNNFQNYLNKLYSCSGPGYFERYFLLNELNKLFNIKSWEYAPRILGSIIYEILLTIKVLFNHNPSVSNKIFIIFYPIMYFDRFLNGKLIGSEILVVAEKKYVNNNTGNNNSY